MDPSHFLQPELTELNRLPSRAPLDPRPDADAARRADESPWRRSLDGEWRFRLVDRPGAAPRRWRDPGYDDGSWRRIVVPGVWTRQGTGDLPIYTNVQMPWAGLEPPEVPTDNPTGLYRTTVRVPRGWRGRDVVLHVGGAESVLAVWCNGSFVGMGKDSRLPSEFDLTPHLTPGDNVVAAMVIRWSDATWIEDQDHWFHGGIHRSVHLEARGRARIDDLAVVADFDPETRTGRLDVDALVRGDGHSVRVTLETLRGRRMGRPVTSVVASAADDTALDRILAAYAFRGPRAAVSIDAGAVDPWSAEQPDRYRVITELLDDRGEVMEAHATSIGFRRVEIRERRLLINGRAVVLHGVNRHDHHPVTGKTLTMDELREELVLMKRHNIDAVRTSHYPNEHRLLDLCDELGLYVVDEANCEAHARLGSLSHDGRFHHAIVERTRRMVLRDRNHPSVIGWSTGNEAGGGPPFVTAATTARALDPSRFVQYESFAHERSLREGADGRLSPWVPTPDERLASDVVCPMYAPITEIVDWAAWAERTGEDDRPLILCEFSHAMGNSNGSIAAYVDAFHTHPALGGGFVWDWRDQGLAETDEDGRSYWAYGGHFGEDRHDANFCINGLVGPDLTPHPQLREYQWACRPVVTEFVGRRRIRVVNRRSFSSTADLRMTWTWHEDGVAVETGELDIEVPPGGARTVTVPATTRIRAGVETHLTLVWTTRRRSPWAPSGHVVAWDQHELTSAPVPTRAPAPARGDARVELHDAGLAGIWFGARPAIMGDVTATLWRAPTDNDGIASSFGGDVTTGVLRRWRQWGLDALEPVTDDLSVTSRGRRIDLRRRLVGPRGEALHRTRVLLEGERVVVRERIDVPAEWDDLPRVGVRFEVPAELDRLEWFGPGPDETYHDRRGAAPVGRWTSTVDAQYHPFVKPQEHGAHVDARWFGLHGHRGGITVAADPTFVFSARRHHDTTLTAASTLADLEPDATIEVHVDTAMRGLGTGACGPDTLPPFVVRGGSHSWVWTLTPR